MEMSEEEWERQIETNLNGTFYCCKAVLPNMVARRYGKIINISSSAVKNIFPGFGGYAASKCGVVSLTKSLGDEMKHYDINVNAINLGMTCTEDVLRRLEEKDADEAITIQPKDMLQVKDVSEAVLFLASDASKTIMGTDIDLFGKKA